MHRPVSKVIVKSSWRAKTAGGNAAFHNFHNDYAHIQDPNERRRLALAEIDKAPFGWYHVRAIVVAGIGFLHRCLRHLRYQLSDGYVGCRLLARCEIKAWKPFQNTQIPPSRSLHPAVRFLVKSVSAHSQILVGRKRMYGLELIIIIFATLAQALSSDSPAISITGIIIFWRVIMGIGIGGDYPLSSIITSEYVEPITLYAR